MNNSKTRKFFTSENILYFFILLTSLAYAWFTPGGSEYHSKFVFAFLGIGVFFDLMSLFYHTMSLITRKHMSGFPFLGLCFYGWFLLAAKFSIVAQDETSIPRILLFKLVDAVVLIAFHFLCQSPVLLQKPHDK